jgi:hypothetical protein
MDNDNIKLAFSRVKEDILFLTSEIGLIKNELIELKSLLKELQQEIVNDKLDLIAKTPIIHSPTVQQTYQHINPTYNNIPTDTPTVPQEIGGLKSQNMTFSTGNRGVPTDRQTNQQTNPQTHLQRENIEENLKKASDIINSLDHLKLEIRQKFKRLTPQEMTVFSSIYELEENDPTNSTYKQIAINLKLSESSIRDYVLKIIDKGIPIKKQKIDNKKIILSISPELKKIATLSTIMQLRGL